MYISHYRKSRRNWSIPYNISQISRGPVSPGHRTSNTSRNSVVRVFPIYVSSQFSLTNILACIPQELQQINTNQPTYVNLHEGSLCVSDEPFIVPAQPGTGMINLRKFRCMYDLVGDALEAIQAPTSFWYRLFPEDPQFPKTPRIDENVLERWEGTRRLVENAIMGCWIGNIGDGNWERSLHVKKVLASAGF